MPDSVSPTGDTIIVDMIRRFAQERLAPLAAEREKQKRIEPEIIAELVLGVLTTLGLFTRWALALGGLLIAALVFGTAMRSDWNTVGVQMIYAITYYLLLVNRGYNRFSLDSVI